MGVIRVVLADDHRAFVEALATRLRAEPGIEVVAASTSGEEAVRWANQADVALLDMDMVDRSGLEVGQDMLARNPRVRLVAVTVSEDVALVARAMRAGFVAWISKEVSVRQLLEVVHAVCHGETWVSGPLLTKLLQHILSEERDHQESMEIFSTLTPREQDVLRWMVTGASRAEIAQHLFISPNTVRTHMQSILSKLGVHSSLAAVALARRAGVR